jgi:hypothetical protein
MIKVATSKILSRTEVSAPLNRIRNGTLTPRTRVSIDQSLMMHEWPSKIDKRDSITRFFNSNVLH